MSIYGKTIGTILVSGVFLAASATTSFAGPSNGSNLGECYNNWISWCNDHTTGYPNSCYGESMDHCDGVHQASLAQIPGYKVKSLKSQALRKAKRSNAQLVTPTIQPLKRAN